MDCADCFYGRICVSAHWILGFPAAFCENECLDHSFFTSVPISLFETLFDGPVITGRNAQF